MGFLQLPGLGQVHYHQYGRGTKPMLAFHGYGMTGKQFHVLQQSILNEYQVYGFDHFFHGESQLTNYTEAQILAGMPRHWVRQYAEAWFAQHGRQRVSVLAYSIGANFALILCEEFPDLIDDVYLMAPDGLAGYAGFRFLQNNPLGKLLFSGISKSQWLAPGLLKLLKRLHIIDDSLYTIAYNEIDTPKKRLDVYYTLNFIRKLKPNLPQVISYLNQYHIPVTFVFGQHDMLFPLGASQAWVAQIPHATVHHVPMGHWLVTPQLDDYLINLPHDTRTPQ